MDSEIFDKAQSIMTNRRMRAISENEQRIREINQKLPQIKEINDVLYNTGKELIKIISAKNQPDVQQKIQQLLFVLRLRKMIPQKHPCFIQLKRRIVICDILTKRKQVRYPVNHFKCIVRISFHNMVHYKRFPFSNGRIFPYE